MRVAGFRLRFLSGIFRGEMTANWACRSNWSGMRALSAGLFIFATVVFISSALPEGKEKGVSPKLMEQGKPNGKSLQRRKPPVKIPGPQLTSDETHPEFDEPKLPPGLLASDHGKHKKHLTLTQDKNKKHLAPSDGHSKGKNKHKHVASRDDMETQEERSDGF